jgi:hypothetical protein
MNRIKFLCSHFLLPFSDNQQSPLEKHHRRAI